MNQEQLEYAQKQFLIIKDIQEVILVVKLKNLLNLKKQEKIGIETENKKNKN